MPLDVHESIHSFFKFEVAPHLLDTVSCSLLYEVIHWQLSQRPSKFVSPISLLNLRRTTDFDQKQFKEDQKLLIFIRVYLSVVIQDGKA